MPFSAAGTPKQLLEHQQRVSAYLLRHRLSQVVFHPGLTDSFKYLVTAQLNEFSRLYGAVPDRLDGHHHMHLCANVLMPGLLTAGSLVRRNFSFQSGEKSFLNRLYRRAVDHVLARRHRLTDFLFCLQPLTPASRLQKIFSLANESTVEVETHPMNQEEYEFLVGGEIFRWTRDLSIAPCYGALVRRTKAN
jgi:hypothetical protein